MKRILIIIVATIIAPMVFILWLLSVLFLTLGTGFNSLSEFITDNTIDKLEK